MVLIKQSRDKVSVVDATLKGLLNDVDGFQRVLDFMRETFAQSGCSTRMRKLPTRFYPLFQNPRKLWTNASLHSLSKREW
jgi:hypothetical protein